MSSSKKIDLKRDFADGGYLSEPPRPLHTIRVYILLIRTEEGGKVE